MAVCKKVLLVWCLLVAQSCALRIKREEVKHVEENVDPEKKFNGGAMHDSDSGSMHSASNSYSDDSVSGSMVTQRKCPQYHSCMNRLDELQDSMKSLKSERAVMMGTLKTIINKGKDQQADISKLSKKAKMLTKNYMHNDKKIRPQEVKIAKNVRKIDEAQDKSDDLNDMVSAWREKCSDAQADIEQFITIGEYSNYLINPDRASNSKNWFAAQEFCKSYGMSLVTIDDQDEFDELETLLLAANAGDTGFDLSGYWIGLNTLGDNNVLRWSAAGNTLSGALSDPWQDNEPDYGDNGDYRVINWYDDGSGSMLWSAEHALENSSFICEQSPLCYAIAQLDIWLADEAMSGESDDNSDVDISSDEEDES